MCALWIASIRAKMKRILQMPHSFILTLRSALIVAHACPSAPSLPSSRSKIFLINGKSIPKLIPSTTTDRFRQLEGLLLRRGKQNASEAYPPSSAFPSLLGNAQGSFPLRDASVQPFQTAYRKNSRFPSAPGNALSADERIVNPNSSSF